MTGFAGFDEQGTRRAVIVADDALARDDAAEAARAAGVTVAGTIGFAGLATALADLSHADVLLVEAAGVATASLEQALPLLADRAARDRAQLVVSFPIEALDVVGALLLGGPATLLCEARPDERVAEIAFGGAVGSGMQAAERDAERLRRLNAEVARIAHALLRLSREGGDEGVRDRSADFVAPSADDAGPADIAAATVRGAIRARRMRDQFLPKDLFADPGWDMLLDLFAARLEGSRVSVSSLCIASAVPPTTALRWITTLTDAGLLMRREDPSDRRRAFIVLTARGVAGMEGYAQAVAKAGLGWA
ncbi:winged helix DNA-binding protein [Sphingomonas sp. 2R-10]|uniref:winged helix DNA-binding protein n=1 Tax=Sphingomonas sp. 2R-10 TaxID=3045148 RepID=UPI0019D29858|nr:winged helix DNA-binding protein [Sphingomonas sp. 2R-10]MDJ0278707.1 winged helix DNA-binding protein [Sphingomonas sp. 2R-10]